MTERVPASVPSHAGPVRAWLHDAGPDSPAAVVAHGSGPATREYLDAEARTLAERGVTVLVADKQLAGYDALHRDYDALADTLAAQASWLRERGHPRVTLVGFSEGTWVAAIAAVRPGVADAVALLSAPVVDVADQTAHEYLCWWPRGWPGRRGTHRLLTRLLWAALPAYRRGIGPELRALEVPALAVWGKADPLVDVPRAQALLATSAPHVAQVVVRGTGHGLRRDQEHWLAAVAALARGEHHAEA